jgi:hypothetical protein
MRRAPTALAVVLAGPALLAGAASRPPPLAVFVVDREVTVPDTLTPAGEAARRDAQRLRTRLLDALRNVDEIVLVADEAAADARLEFREAAVHRLPRPPDAEGGSPRKPPGVRGTIGEHVTDVALGRIEGPDHALTVRLSSARRFADFSSTSPEPSASSAVATVVRALRRWVREHRRELVRAGGP